jgi:cellulose synthase/poly-beta-1,6-N-acetylglucosamine synthase-like glycosyltransferase
MTLAHALFFAASTIVIAAALWGVILNSYRWHAPETPARSAWRVEPERLHQLPTICALVPARHERDVLEQTLRTLLHQEPPGCEVVVIVGHDDHETRDVAETVAQRYPDRCRVVVDESWPKSKPKALMSALPTVTCDIVAIFDAEDDVAPGVCALAAAEFAAHDDLAALQGGVLLTNTTGSWLASRAAVEYGLWYSSRLPWQAVHGFVPLGGNTCFLRASALRAVGGWDGEALTEDADIAVRLAAQGYRTEVRFDEAYVTREESPEHLRAFVRQRTRWVQGFVQVIRKGEWRALPRRRRMLALATLLSPFQQALAGAVLPSAMLAYGLTHRVPVDLVLVSWVALFVEAAAAVFDVRTLVWIERLAARRARLRDVALLLLGLIPYQLVLLYAVVAALAREARGVRTWVKTTHTGAHRFAAPPAVPDVVGAETLPGPREQAAEAS